MKATTTAEGLRAGLRSMWATVAPAWGKHADYADARGVLITGRMLDLAAVERGQRVLELASGAGGLGIAAAERVGADGEVVLSDFVPEMTSIAASRAASRGMNNVAVRVLDLEDIDEPDETYDAVLCREGLMFASEPAGALAEIRRVLRPGGRVAIAVWGPREQNPWLAIVLDAVSAELGRPVPPAGVPGPFALSDRDRLASLMSGAGLTDVSIAEVAVPLRAGSFDEWWTRTSDLAGPLANVLRSLPAVVAAAIRERAQQAVREYETANGVEIPGLTLLAGARR